MSMHLVQILLPIHDNAQQEFPGEEYLRVRQELTEKFGGLTVYTRAPAEGSPPPPSRSCPASTS